MDDSQREFLEILIYLFLRYNKFDEAFTVAQILGHYFPKDPFIALSLAFSALRSDAPNAAFDAIQNVENIQKNGELEKLFFVLKSKTMWALGKDIEARTAFTHFLGLQEQDLRLAVACNPKTKVRS